jgi:hypothetical protein
MRATLARSPSIASITETTLGLGWTGKRIGEIVAVGDAADRAGDRRHAVTEILAAMGGDEDDALAGESARRSDRARPPAPARRRRAPRVASSASITVLPVTWIAAGATFSRRSASAAVSVGAKCWSAIGRDDAAVHFLGPGMEDVARAQPRLDMADGILR